MSVRVLFIGGLGRSGSTVLELLLGQVAGVAAIGEVRHLWERGLRDNSLCACGQPFHDCAFWRSVGDEAFGGWARVDPSAAIAAARAVDRHRQLPLVATGLPRRRAAVARYGDTLERLFGAVGDVSGAGLIVDSSKDPPHGFVLRQAAGLDLRAVHMVRDPRGVAYSWSKVVERPDAARRGTLMTRMSPARTALMWLDTNLLVEGLRTRVPTVRVRYEELVADPHRQLRRVLRPAGFDLPDGPPAGQIDPALQHAIAGNPVRFRREPAPLVLDDEWTRAMPPRERRLVTAITAPLLRRYSYPVLAA